MFAVRGERLALSRNRFATAGGDELRFLSLSEVDETGLGTLVALFDPDDLLGALDLLEQRYVAGEGAPDAAVIAAQGRFTRAFAQRDRAALLDVYRASAVVVDRRRLGFGQLSSGEFVARDVALWEVSPDIVNLPRKLYVSGSAGLVVHDQYGTSADGGTYEWPSISVATIDDAGRTTRVELFAVEDFEEALARMEELAEHAPRATGPIGMPSEP